MTIHAWQVDESLTSLGKAKDSIVGRLTQFNSAEALSLLGLDKEFIDAEIKLVESLSQGTAIEHHLEPSYFAAMQSAIDAVEARGQSS